MSSGLSEGSGWTELQDGVEYISIELHDAPMNIGEKRLHALRIDPSRARLTACLASQTDGQRRSAGQWCEDFNLIAAINLGMYHKDLTTNVGYMRNGAHVNSEVWVENYKSALAFGPLDDNMPEAVALDLDHPGAREYTSKYRTVVQNLRLIKGKGKNVWRKKERKWSESALAMDERGRILFIFCQTPYPMDVFIDMLISQPLGIVRAMHLEGGTAASFSVHSDSVKLDLCGIHESGLMEGADLGQFLLPNVLGVKREN